MNKRTIVAIMLILSTAILTACSIDSTKTNQTEQKELFETEEIKGTYINAALKFVQNHEVSSLFSDDFLDNNSIDFDKIENAEIKHCYYSNNAIYIQINNESMFRFQLDNTGKIISYIVYNLEA